MPALTVPAHILVTGASGFLGPHIINALLAAGFDVSATVRDENKAAYLKSTFPSIEAVLIPDQSDPGAYDAAVKSIDGVVHAASPLDLFNTGDPALVIDPAVRGVTGILASMEGSGVKRIVLISSLAAVMDADWDNGKREYTEDCKPWTQTQLQYAWWHMRTLLTPAWNSKAPAICVAQGASAAPAVKYRASKVLSERAFWEYFNTKRSFDGVSLACALIFGEPLGYAASQGRLEGSNTFVLPWMEGPHTEAEMRAETMPVVAAADVATAVVRSLTTPEASGERFLIASGPVHFNDYAIAADVLDNKNLTPGNTDPAYRAKLDEGAATFDTSKADRIFGLEFKDKDEVLAEGMCEVKAFMVRHEKE